MPKKEGMFSGFEDWLQENRKPLQDNREKARDLIGGLEQALKKGRSKNADELESILKDSLKGKGFDVQEISAENFTSLERIKDKILGLEKSLAYIGQQLKVSPKCLDSEGNELKLGDMLDVPGGFVKKVLKVGYGFVNLSHTDDHNEDDGVWFEDRIVKGKFKLKK